MKKNTKSSITLPPNELALVLELQKSLRAKSKVEVIRQGLIRLKESLDRDKIRSQYEAAAKAVREVTKAEVEDLDHLSSEGIGEK